MADARLALARALAPDPNYTYGNILPLAKNNTTGALSPAMPGVVRSGLQGLADLVNMRTAPSAQPGVNTLTPDALGALSMLPAGGMAAAERGAVGMFGGRLAATADRNALAKAESMAAAGTPRDKIWADTGWFQGPDKKWRFEIDDSKARLAGNWPTQSFDTSPNKVAANKYANVGQSIDHTKAFDAYADLRDVGYSGRAEYGPDTRLWRRDNGTIVVGSAGGVHTPSRNSISANGVGPTRDVAKGGVVSSTLHELQHAIQSREGFAGGGSPENFARGPMFDENVRNMTGDFSTIVGGGPTAVSPKEIAEAVASATAKPHPGDKEWMDDLAASARRYGFTLAEAMERMAAEDLKRTPAAQYRRLAGEVEARNVQTRMNFTPAERLAKTPWTTADVPDDQQIVRMGLAQAMSAAKALPMDEASRMARAAEQGYSGADWFRGVSGDHGIRPNSMWTNDPREAGAYARGSALTNTGEAANIIPAKIRGAKGRNIDDEVMDALEAGDNPDVVAAQIMKDESLDYVEFYHPSTMGDDHLVRVVADPKNIRSRFAAFDPAKKDSTDLLASRSPGYPLAWQQPQDQRRVELARALSKVQK